MGSVPSLNLANERLVAEIDLEAVRWNVRQVLALAGPGVEMMAVVKADAYGHGELEVARAAVEGGAAWLGVATVNEGVRLRDALETTPICVLSPFAQDEAEAIVRYRLTPMLGDALTIGWLSKAAGNAGSTAMAHLEVDTGMGRSGALPNDALNVLSAAQCAPNVSISGIATHFASAENDPEYTRAQIDRFEGVRQASGITLVHAANSAATLLFPETRYNMVRPGLLLYGLLPTLPDGFVPPNLKPAMTLKSRIALLRDLPVGSSVSYGRTCMLSRNSRVATIPVGYGDGYPRELSSKGQVLVCGRNAPIMGRVCMDLTMADVTDIPDARVGSEVILIGRQGDLEIRAEEMARLVGTTEHEITARLTARMARVTKDG